MPSLDQHQSAEFVKLLLMGDSGTGKTGALASLVLAGYKLRILDFDNGLDIIAKIIRKQAPEKLKDVEFVTLRDKVRASDTGPIISGVPKAYVNAVKLLDNWTPAKYGLEGRDLGNPRTWGPECILVIDTLTFLSDAAYNWADAMNPNVKDKRQIYYTAQESVASVLAIVTGEEFKTNVIVVSHVTYVERQDGTTKGYPSSVGKAQAPKIPTYFNSVALAEAVGTPPKRTIRTASTALVDLKSPAAMDMAPQMPIETALADYFKTSRT